MQISTQKDNSNRRKNVQTNGTLREKFRKVSKRKKFWNPKCNIFCKIKYFFVIKCEPFGDKTEADLGLDILAVAAVLDPPL